MIELGPHTLQLQNRTGEIESVTVSIFLHGEETYENPDGSEETDQTGEIMLTFPNHERRMKAHAHNTIVVVGSLMMFAEAYLKRLCEVQKLKIFINRPGDVKVMHDIFR
jgi:hypothetical protein